MLRRITIVTRRKLKKARIKAAFKRVFAEEPRKIVFEGKRIIINTDLELNEKKVKKFVSEFGSFTEFKCGEDSAFTFKI